MTATQRNRYFVYIMINSTHRLYVGVTKDIERRVYQHKNKLIEGHTKKYNITWLAHYEETSDVRAALEREKEIKGWRREKKITLIESTNTRWKDLDQDWYKEAGGTP